MSTLRKDNTGFHLPHLFIGSEGMLGVITRAVITCPPRPRSVNLAFLACDSFANCISVLKSAKLELGEILSSFEFLDQATLRMVVKHLKCEFFHEIFFLSKSTFYNKGMIPFYRPIINFICWSKLPVPIWNMTEKNWTAF